MRKLSIYFLFAIIFAMQGSAQTVWNGTADVSWYNASLSSFNITTPEQLAGLAQLVNSGNTMGGKTFNLANDIWLNADGSLDKIWTPIGGKANATSDYDAPVYFSGKFNGNGYKIHNMFVNKPDYYQAGLFGALQTNTYDFDATIHSVVLVNPVVIAKGAAGALLGIMGPRDVDWHATRCQFNTVINAYVYCSGNNAGGVIGNTSNGEQFICLGNVCTGTVIGNNAGGIVGHGQYAEVVNSYFFGSVADVDGGTNYGGISGTTASVLCTVYSNSNTGAGSNGTYKATIADMSTILTDLNSPCPKYWNDFATENVYFAWVADGCGLNFGLPVPINVDFGLPVPIDVDCDVTCQAPLKGAVTNIGPYSADITWIGDAGTGAFEIEYGPAATFEPTGSAQYIETGNSVSLSGLDPSTSYTVAVRKDCGGGDYSNRITYYFTTAILCEQPKAFTASNQTNTTIDLTWTGPVNVTSYNIEWGTNDNSWTPGASNAPGSDISYTANYQITGLTDATVYKIAVQADCGTDDGTSQWTTIVSATTVNETYGQDLWHGYVYNSPDGTPSFGDYLGYVEQLTPQFSVSNNSDPWTGSNDFWVNGSSGPLDNFTVRYKMTYDFPCGNYTINLQNIDDQARLSIDGGATWLIPGVWGTATMTGSWSGSAFLNGATNLVLDFYENGGGAGVSINWSITALNNVTVNGITDYSANVTVAGGNENALYQHVVSKTGVVTNPDAETPIARTGNIFTLSGLTPATQYNLWVRTACPNGSGAWKQVSFTTTANCTAVSNLAVSNRGRYTAYIDFTPLPNVTNYTVEWGTQSFTPGTGAETGSATITASDLPYQITGLTAATQYKVAVLADCCIPAAGPWATLNFNTERCEPEEQCTYTLTLGGKFPEVYELTEIDIKQNGISAFFTGTMNGKLPIGTVFSFTLCKGLSTEITAGVVSESVDYLVYEEDADWQLKSPSGLIVASKARNTTSITGAPFTVGNDCESCTAPAISNKSYTICSGSAFTMQTAGTDAIPIGTTTYTWTVADNANVTGKRDSLVPASVMSQTLTNTTNTPQTVTYTVTPTTDNCTGNSFNVEVTVNPQARWKIVIEDGSGGEQQGTDIQICEGEVCKLIIVGIPPFSLTYIVNGEDPSVCLLSADLADSAHLLTPVDGESNTYFTNLLFEPDTYNFQFTKIEDGNGCELIKP